MSKLSSARCAIQGCNSSIFNKSIQLTFHPFPQSAEMRNKWLSALRNRCPMVDWTKSRICSKHFENKHFDSSRKLKENAVPTMFPMSPGSSNQRLIKIDPKNKLDKLLSNMPQAELINDVKTTFSLISVPDNYADCVTNDLQCVPDTPIEAQLWLLIKKQDHLIARLMQQNKQNKKHVEILQKNMKDSRIAQKEQEKNIEKFKYIVKSLQEKHATLEEQIEILTAVESR